MKRLLLGALVVIIIAGSWVLYSAQHNKVATLPEGVKTAPVERASIESLISATGSVAAEHEQSLSFATSGTVVQVLVAQGDRVVAGQPLARVDDEELRLNLMQAQAAVAVAEAQLAQTKVGASSEEITRYQAAVDIARSSLKAAQAGVESAQANLDRLLAGATVEEVAIAERRIAEAKNSLWGAQSQRDAICGRVKMGGAQADCDNAQAGVGQAEENVRIAELQLQTTLNGARAEDVTAARAAVEQAKAQQAQAHSQVAQAEADLARAKSGPQAEQVAVVEAQVNQAKVGVMEAQARLDDAVLTAPAAGTLARWQVFVGDRVTAGSPVGTLVDDTRYHLTVAIDETDIHKVAVGQPARLTLDAYPDVALTGHVTSIDLLGDTSQGIVTYSVRIDLDPTQVSVRPMMTTTVDIVAERKDNVVRVPNRAVRRDAAGRYVQIVRNGQLVRVDIQVGVSDTEYTEITSGLDEGEEVVVALPRSDLFSGMAGAR